MSNELKKCPFCGSEGAPQLISNAEMVAMYNDDYEPCYEDGHVITNGWFVICSAGGNEATGCGSNSGWGTEKEDAIKIWNRRA